MALSDDSKKEIASIVDECLDKRDKKRAEEAAAKEQEEKKKREDAERARPKSFEEELEQELK